MSNIKTIIFDLDDTLLDTTKQLRPAAHRSAARKMIQAGLETDEESLVTKLNNSNLYNIDRFLEATNNNKEIATSNFLYFLKPIIATGIPNIAKVIFACNHPCFDAGDCKNNHTPDTKIKVPSTISTTLVLSLKAVNFSLS